MSRARENATVGEEFASGTKMVFNQTAAPTGWTKVTSSNDVALRVVSGTVGTGGSVAFTTAFASQTPAGSVSVSGTVGATSVSGTVGARTLSTSEIPSHTHTSTGGLSVGSGGHAYSQAYNRVKLNTGSAGGGGSHNHSFSGGSHNHSFSGSGTFTGTAINLAVQYVDVIIATKD